MSFKLQLNGLEETIKKLQRIESEVSDDVDNEIGAGLREMEKTMKALVPVNDGILKNNIGITRYGKMDWAIGAYSPYAAYMEFGTKKKFDPVTGYEELAAAAKGKGNGTYKEFLKSLERWVYKKVSKKNAKSIAYAIAKKIIVDGVKGNHYFTRSIEAYKPKMIENIRKAINK